MWKPQRSWTLGEHSQDWKINWTHRGSQRLECQWHSLHGCVLGPLQISYDLSLGVLRWTPNSGSRCLSDYFTGSWNPYWDALPSLDVRVCTCSYCILLCRISSRDNEGRSGREERWGEIGLIKMQEKNLERIFVAVS